jgi:hypothetical protein
MSRASIAIAAAAALLIACGSDNNNNTPDGGTDGGVTLTQAQAATQLCTTISTTCTGSDDQFEAEPENACEDSVKSVPASSTDARGNTPSYNIPVTDPHAKNDDLTCRLAELQLASTDAANKATHCRNAGPTGGGTATAVGKCGDLCDVYCDLQERNCTTASPNFAALSPAITVNFSDHAACVSQCTAELAKGPGTHFSKGGKVNSQAGDTLQCRIWHLGKAAGNPRTHCPHTRFVSNAADVVTPAPTAADCVAATGRPATCGPCSGAPVTQ